MDVYTALRGRRGAATLRPDPPPRAVIQHLIDIAIWAPNHHLTEPWRFHVLAGAARSAMGNAVAAALERERDLADPVAQSEIKAARAAAACAGGGCAHPARRGRRFARPSARASRLAGAGRVG